MSTPAVKCVIVGNAYVGKTCLCIRYHERRFASDYVPTVFDNYNVIREFNGNAIQLALWDSAGQEDYDRLRPLSYPGTHVFLVCFDVASEDSWDDVNKNDRWLSEIHYHCPDIPFLIIGLKDDLRDALIFSNIEEIQKLTNGYLRKYEIEYHNIPLDVLGMIEKYLIMKQEMDYHEQFVTDEEAEQLCKERGGYKYMTCSALIDRGVDEVFDEVLKCWNQTDYKKRATCGCLLL